MKLLAADYLKTYAVHAGLLLLALIAGAIAAQGDIKLLILIIGLFIAPIPIFCPAEIIYKSLLLCNCFIVGMVGYFADIQQMHWIPSLLFVALLVRLPFDMLSFRHRNRQQPITLVFVSLVGFCAALIISAIANQTPAPQIILGIKHFIFPLAVTTLIVYSDFNQAFWLKIFRYIPTFIIVQLPIALYQYFFIAKAREKAFNTKVGAISWDAVVGSFGGNAEAGGASGALALFLCFGVVVTYILQKNQQINSTLAITAYLSALIIIVLAETKIVIFYLPLALLAYQRKNILTSPLTLVLTVSGIIIFIPSLLLLYNSMHYSSVGGGIGSGSISELLEYTFKTEANTDAFNAETAELSRSSAFKLWWIENIENLNPLNAVFGHGPAASKVSATFGMGAAAKNFPFSIALSTLTALLWDLGLLGTFALMSALFAAALSAFSYANRSTHLNAYYHNLYEACGVLALLLLASVGYDLSIMENPITQTIMATTFGMILSNNTRDPNASIGTHIKANVQQ